MTINLLKDLGFKRTKSSGWVFGYELNVGGLTLLSTTYGDGKVGVTIYESGSTMFVDYNSLVTFINILKEQKTYDFYSKKKLKKNLTSNV